ncbi:MAG: cation:proton antiporter domain-containing protein, partial [Planctomycetota bacterium]
MSSRHRTRRLMLPAAAVAAVWLLPGAASAANAAAPETAAHQVLDRMMVLVIQLGVILFAAKLGNILFTRLRLPGALGELVSGIIIGPYALGRIGFYGFGEGLFPAVPPLGVSPELYGLTVVAAVVLMFNVGLETNVRMLLRQSAAGALAGIGGVVASLGLAAAVAVGLGPMLLGEPVSLLSPGCLMLAIIATATSVGITARILSERGKLNSPEGLTILSAAVIDDVVGIILLAVVLAAVRAGRSAEGMQWGHVGIVAAKAVGVWLAATALGLMASRRISFVLKGFRDRTSIAVMALGLALVVAGLFEEAGLAMIIGAYVMGLSLSKADIARVVQERLQPIYVFLVPVFFCVSGMRINLASLGSPAVLGFGLAYAAAALAAKVFGAGLPTLLANFNLRGAMRVGFGMAPRCEVALIIAGAGLTAGLMGSDLFAAVIVMVVVNTVVAPLALTRLFRSPVAGVRKPVEVGESVRTSVAFDLPSPEMADFLAADLGELFRAEGFFVHLINRQERIYQLRRDGTTIEYQCGPETLTFYCNAGDVPMVNAAMYEALADLERTIKGLRKPLDAQRIATRIQAPAPEAQPASLAAYLRPELIKVHLDATDKAGVIDELLDLLDAHGQLLDRDRAGEDVRRREESMSTGLQYGVAIPHAKSDGVNRLVCAVGLKREGIDFDSMDGEPARIFIMTLSPADKPAPHVEFMSAVSRLLDSERRPAILACRSAEQVYELLCGGPIAPAPPAAGAFRLADYLRPELLTTDLAGTTPTEVIDELLGMLDRAGCLRDVCQARRAVLQREQQMPTGLQDGIALPH